MASLTYEELLREIQPRPIRSAAALERTYKLIDRLMSQARLSRSESEMLEMLSILVEQYESIEHPTPELPPPELLAHLLDVRGVSRADVARETGIARSIVTEILGGRRGISRVNMNRLAKFFDVSPGVFLKTDGA